MHEHWSELEEMLVKSMLHTFCRNSERTSRTNEQLCYVETSTGFSSPWSRLDDLSIWEQTWNTDKVLSISYWPSKSDSNEILKPLCSCSAISHSIYCDCRSLRYGRFLSK
jgi:hypothetical protein